MINTCTWLGDNAEEIRRLLAGVASGVSLSRVDPTRLVVLVDGAHYRVPPGTEISWSTDSLMFEPPAGAVVEYRDQHGTGQSRPGALVAIVRPGD